MKNKISLLYFILLILTFFIYSCSLSEPKLSGKQKNGHRLMRYTFLLTVDIKSYLMDLNY